MGWLRGLVEPVKRSPPPPAGHAAGAAPDVRRPAPSLPADRIVSIDVIRGVAIAGILLINISYFLSRAGQSPASRGTDAVIWQVVDVLALGKFHFVFAFLFGTGVFIFLSRLRAKGRSRWVYIRRMIILMMAGILNSAFGGIDVLTSYGALGLVLLLLVLLPGSLLLAVGVVAAIGPDALALLTTTGAGGPDVPPALMLLLEFGRTLGHMTLGYCLAERGLFAVGTRIPVKAVFTTSLVLSAPIWVWTVVAGTGTELAHEIAFRTAMIPGLLYISGLILVLRQPRARRGLSFLRFYGRMAFSNYLGQTVICVTVLPPFVTSGHVSALTALGFCLAVIVFQCVFSVLWLRWFRYGPLEWVWRCGTYLELTPLLTTGSHHAQHPDHAYHR